MKLAERIEGAAIRFQSRPVVRLVRQYAGYDNMPYDPSQNIFDLARNGDIPRVASSVLALQQSSDPNPRELQRYYLLRAFDGATNMGIDIPESLLKEKHSLEHPGLIARSLDKLSKLPSTTYFSVDRLLRRVRRAVPLLTPPILKAYTQDPSLWKEQRHWQDLYPYHKQNLRTMAQTEVMSPREMAEFLRAYGVNRAFANEVMRDVLHGVTTQRAETINWLEANSQNTGQRRILQELGAAQRVDEHNLKELQKPRLRRRHFQARQPLFEEILL